MLSKLLKQLKQHKIITAMILLVIVGSGYFGYQKLSGDKNTVRYVTAAVEKGALIVSVSGSGQVVVLDQFDIKPKVSGEIATLYIKKDQKVKEGSLLAALDSRDAGKAIRDAEVALESAKAKLEELLSQPDDRSLLQAKNVLTQAERDLDQAKENYEEIKIDTERSIASAYEDLDQAKENYEEIGIDAERSLATAYEDGYSSVSNTFFKLSDYMKDLKDVLGTEQSAEEYIAGYKLILSSDSLFIQKLLDDYYQALNSFNKKFAFFRTVFQDDDRDTIYQLIGDTLETAKVISQALESARHMYDAIMVESYQYLKIAVQVDKMQPKIESDVSSVYSDISSLERIKDTIDDTNKNTPEKIKDAESAIKTAQEKVDDTNRNNPKKIRDAELAIKSAQEKIDEKKLDLEELMAGTDPQDIESQRNAVAQKEDALLDAKEELAEHFIRAPFDGVIAEIKVKKGDSVSTGTVLATLITQQKIAEISLNEVDAAKVKVGQRATLTFDALPEVSISGKVIDVDALGTVAQGVVSYGVKIAFDIEDERIKPGMSVTADIITDAKQDALVLLNSAIKSQGNSYYVELVEVDNNEFRQQLLANVSGIILPKPPQIQAVEIGLSNDLSTEIVFGLKEGDIVVASTISQNKTQTTPARTTPTGGFQMPGMEGQRELRIMR